MVIHHHHNYHQNKFSLCLLGHHQECKNKHDSSSDNTEMSEMFPDVRKLMTIAIFSAKRNNKLFKQQIGLQVYMTTLQF